MTETVNTRNNRNIVLVSSQQVSLPAQDRHKIKPVSILAWDGKRFMSLSTNEGMLTADGF